MQEKGTTKTKHCCCKAQRLKGVRKSATHIIHSTFIISIGIPNQTLLTKFALFTYLAASNGSVDPSMYAKLISSADCIQIFYLIKVRILLYYNYIGEQILKSMAFGQSQIL